MDITNIDTLLTIRNESLPSLGLVVALLVMISVSIRRVASQVSDGENNTYYSTAWNELVVCRSTYICVSVFKNVCALNNEILLFSHARYNRLFDRLHHECFFMRILATVGNMHRTHVVMCSYSSCGTALAG